MRNLEYKILRTYTFLALEKDVNSHLKDGWELQGGVSVATSSFSIKSGRSIDHVTEYLVSQALTRSIPMSAEDAGHLNL